MATAKDKPEVEVVVDTKKEEVVEAKAPAKAAPKQKPQIDLKEMVPVRNITNGSLTYVSKKTGAEIHWSDFGAEEYIDVAELLTMKSGQPRFFNEPWVMIDDENVIEYLGLRQLYDRIVNPDNIEEFFYLSVEDIADKLKKAPHGTKELVASKAREMVENGTLDSVRIVRVLEKELHIDLSMVQ
jgi:hypothetical protein